MSDTAVDKINWGGDLNKHWGLEKNREKNRQGGRLFGNREYF